MTKRQHHIIDYGGEGETIVFLHGFLSSHHYWRKLAPSLVKSGFHVISIDLIGFGNAPKPASSSYTYNTHVQYVHNALAQAGVNQPITLVGHSMGALIAMRYARHYQAWVRTLVLLHPPLYINTEQARTTLRDTSVLYKFLLDHPARHIAWGTMRRLSMHNLARHSAISRERSLEHIIERAEGMRDINRLAQPTLLILGSRDRQIYIDNARIYLKNSHVLTKIIDTGHHSVMSRPQLILRLIASFAQNSKRPENKV